MFDLLQLSRYRAKPIQYFSFGVGPGKYIRVVSGDDKVDFDNGDGEGMQEYLPADITMDEITQTGNLDKTPVNITLPQKGDLAHRFLKYPPAQEVSCLVFLGHAGDVEAKHGFTGTVLTSKRQKSGMMVLQCENVMAAYRRPGLQRTLQIGCPYVVFVGRCKADKARVTSNVIVQATGNTTVDLPVGWNGSIALEKYLGGTAEWASVDGGVEVRWIIDATATQINVNGPIRDLADFATLSVTAGCNRARTDCLELHETITAEPVIRFYGGQDFIPDEDPWKIINTYYGG